jgi:hypothetical protein
VGLQILPTPIHPTICSWPGSSSDWIHHNTYSVPARLIGENVRVRRYDDRLEVRFRAEPPLVIPRLLGRNGHRIDYRHVIWSLVRKPGAFARYRYRDDLFPTVTFRRAYDAIAATRSEIGADAEYVRILHLAASVSQADVEIAVALLLDASEAISADRVRALVRPGVAAIPEMAPLQVDLHAYDALIAGGAR